VIDGSSKTVVIFCPETKKPPWQVVFTGSEGWHQLNHGNWIISRNSHQIFPFQCNGQNSLPQEILIPASSYQRLSPLALCRARTDWTSSDCCRSVVKVGLNGETLQTTQTCSGTPQHGTSTGRYEKTGHITQQNRF
jgi:hypothetical protein